MIPGYGGPPIHPALAAILGKILKTGYGGGGPVPPVTPPPGGDDYLDGGLIPPGTPGTGTGGGYDDYLDGGLIPPPTPSPGTGGGGPTQGGGSTTPPPPVPLPPPAPGPNGQADQQQLQQLQQRAGHLVPLPHPAGLHGARGGGGVVRWGGHSFSDPGALVSWINAHGGHTSVGQFLSKHPGVSEIFRGLAPSNAGGAGGPREALVRKVMLRRGAARPSGHHPAY